MFSSFAKQVVSRINGLFFSIPGKLDADCPDKFCRVSSEASPFTLTITCGVIDVGQQDALEANIPGFTWGDPLITVNIPGQEDLYYEYSDEAQGRYNGSSIDSDGRPFAGTITVGEVTVAVMLIYDNYNCE